MVAVALFYFVFINGSFVKAGDEKLPHARRPQAAHRMPAAVPPVELTDKGDLLGIGRPHGEHHAFRAIDFPNMRPQVVINPVMVPFVEQVPRIFAHDRKKAVRVPQPLFRAIEQRH